MEFKDSVSFETTGGLVSNTKSLMRVNSKFKFTPEHIKLLSQITDNKWKEFIRVSLIEIIGKLNM